MVVNMDDDRFGSLDLLLAGVISHIYRHKSKFKQKQHVVWCVYPTFSAFCHILAANRAILAKDMSDVYVTGSQYLRLTGEMGQ